MVGTIRSRFFAVGLFFILWMGIAVGFSLMQITAVSGDLATLSRFVEPIKDALYLAQTRQLELGTLLTRYLRLAESDSQQDRAQMSGLRIEIQAKQKTILSNLSQAKTLAAEGLGDRAADVSRDMMDQMIREMRGLETQTRTLVEAIDQVMDTADAGDLTQARAQELSVRGLQREMTSLLTIATVSLNSHGESVVEMVSDRENMLVQVEVVLLTLAAAGGLVLAGYFGRTMVKATKEWSQGTQAIADGDLDFQLSVESGNAELDRMNQSFNRMVRELRFNRRVIERFGKQLNPKVVRDLIKEETALDASENRVMTLVVNDLTGFDRLAEQWPPELLKEFLIDYLNAMCDPVSTQKGIVDTFIADRVVSFWGPPFCSEQNHAKRACMTALDQMARFENLKQKYADRINDTPFGLRIGITTGEVVVGSVGTHKRQYYTVVGNSLNYASRLERANRIYRTEILMSEETVAMLGDDFVVRDLDKVVLVGTDKPAHFYELVGRTGHVPDEEVHRIGLFETAMAHYRHGEFDKAVPLFQQALDQNPDDFAPQLFLNRIERLSRREQEREWDGVWVVRDPYERREADG